MTDAENKAWHVAYSRKYRAMQRPLKTVHEIEQLRKDLACAMEKIRCRIARDADREEKSRKRVLRHRMRQKLYRANNRDKIRASKNRYKIRHADKVKADNAAHRAHASKRSPCRGIRVMYRLSASSKTIACYWCGKMTKKCGREVDHITPVSKGGWHRADNLCISCVKCNQAKSNRDANEFSKQGILL